MQSNNAKQKYKTTVQINSAKHQRKPAEAYQSESFDGAADDVIGHRGRKNVFGQMLRTAVQIHDYHVQQLGNLIP